MDALYTDAEKEAAFATFRECKAQLEAIAKGERKATMDELTEITAAAIATTKIFIDPPEVHLARIRNILGQSTAASALVS